MHSTLDEMLAKVQAMDPATKAAVTDLVLAKTADAIWFPSPGPQAEAYNSDADL